MQLKIESVSKQYRQGFWGLQDVNLQLRPGVIGLLGPNGAGKTSLMNILATITQPTNGRVLWNGINIAQKPDELRRVLGYLPQDFGVYPHLNALEFLRYMAAIKGLPQKVAHISKPQPQRLPSSMAANCASTQHQKPCCARWKAGCGNGLCQRPICLKYANAMW